MRSLALRRLSNVLALSAAGAVLVLASGSCAYKKKAKAAGSAALECDEALLAVSKKKDIVTVRGCTREERYMWYCKDDSCTLLPLAAAVENAAFIADCAPEEMTLSVLARAKVAVDGCGQQLVLVPSLNGWAQADAPGA